MRYVLSSQKQEIRHPIKARTNRELHDTWPRRVAVAVQHEEAQRDAGRIPRDCRALLQVPAFRWKSLPGTPSMPVG